MKAESLAYVVCSAAGLASAAYSLPYLVRWADGDPAVVRRTAEQVVTAAHAVLAAAGLTRPTPCPPDGRRPEGEPGNARQGRSRVQRLDTDGMQRTP